MYSGLETNTKQFKDSLAKLSHQTIYHPRPVRRKESSTITRPASSEETKIAIDVLLSLGSDIIPENDITTENSALVSVGLNIPPSVEGNLDVINDSKNDVPSQPTPLHQSLHLHWSHKQTPQMVIWQQTMTQPNQPTVKQQAQILRQRTKRKKVL